MAILYLVAIKKKTFQTMRHDETWFVAEAAEMNSIIVASGAFADLLVGPRGLVISGVEPFNFAAPPTRPCAPNLLLHIACDSI